MDIGLITGWVGAASDPHMGPGAVYLQVSLAAPGPIRGSNAAPTQPVINPISISAQR